MSKINCTTCGAKTDSLSANCEYCGVEYAKAQMLTPDEYLAAIGKAYKKSAEAHDSDSMDSVTEKFLRELPVPSEISTLVAFFAYCNGNVNSTDSGPDHKAWKGKAKNAYDMLRLAGLNNPKINTFLEDYKSIYSEAGMEKAKKAENMEILMYVILIIGIVVATKMILF